MKLKLDENLGQLGRDVLTAQGHDVSTVAMQRMSGSVDVTLYEACRIESRGSSRSTAISAKCFASLQRTAPVSRSLTAEADFRQVPSLHGSTKLALVLAIQSISGQLWIVEPGRVRVHEKRERP